MSPANLTEPFRTVAQTPTLPMLTLASFCLAAIQGNLFSFAVTYLTDEIGLNLIEAGAASSAMLIAGVAGRILMGWIADRLGSAIAVLRILAFTAAGATFMMSTIDRSWSYGAIVALFAATGILATTWNGVFLAEVARIAPKGKVGLATAGSAFITFLAYSFGPFVFATSVSTIGAYGPVYAGVSALGIVAAIALLIAGRMRKP